MFDSKKLLLSLLLLNISIGISIEQSDKLPVSNSSTATNLPASSTPKPRPDMFANSDPRLVNLLIAYYRNLNKSQILNLTLNGSWMKEFDSIKNWATKSCFIGFQYYLLIENEIAKKGDQSWANFDRLITTIPCKRDCDFNMILSSNNTVFALNKTEFFKSVLPLLPPQVGAQCKNSIGNYLGPVNGSKDILRDLNNILLVPPSNFSFFSSNDSLDIAKKLANSSRYINKEMAMNLGRNIPKDQTLNGIATIASGVPIECFNNTAPTDLVKLIGSMDVDNMNPNRKNFIAAKIVKTNDSSLIKNFLMNTNDSTVIESVPFDVLMNLKIDVSNIPAANLPTAFLMSYGRNILDNGTLSAVNDSKTLSKVLPAIRKADLNKIQDDRKIETIVNVLNASIVNNIDLSSNQRAAMLDTLLLFLRNRTKSNDPKVYLANLTQSQVQALYPLFLEANQTILGNVSSLDLFDSIISQIPSMDVSDCCIYSRALRAQFALYAVQDLVPDGSNLTSSNLYDLGPCLVSVLPNVYLKTIDPSTFINYFSNLGSTFQPDNDQIETVKSKINAMISNYSSQDIYVFNVLNDLALYYPFTSYSKNLSTFSTNGASLMTKIKSARDPSDPSIQQCRLGLNNTNSIKTDLKSIGSSFIDSYLAAKQPTSPSTGRRKKRAATNSNLTCSDLNNLSGSLNLITAQILSNIASSEFLLCQTLLGSSSNSWSSDQLTALASLAKNAYANNIQSINDTNIVSLNSILLGLADADLANLRFTSINSINTLGALSGWSSSQMTSLNGPVTNYTQTYNNKQIDYNFLLSAGNLVCSLTSDQISQISNADFNSSIPVLSSISTTCPNIQSIYNKAKLAYNNVSFNNIAIINELGSIIAGISLSDLASLSSDSISAISSTAFTYMPKETINSMNALQLSGTSNSQVVALVNSPNYSSFSQSIQNNLQALASSGSVVSTATSDITTTTPRSDSTRSSVSAFFLLMSLMLSLNYN